MGLGDMEIEMMKMLDSLKDELEEEDKKEKKPENKTNINELLSGIEDVIYKEKKRAIEIKKTEKERIQAEKEKIIAQKERMQKILSNKQPAPVNKRYHILIVDDDTRVLKMIKEILKYDYDTGVATNGDVALKFLERHSTDMILLDYMMPGQNGKEVLERIRQHPEYNNVPVVFLTGMSESGKVKECLALRPQGYMLKPIKQFELLKKVKEILG